MAGNKQTPGDKRMLQASAYFAEGKHKKADAEYAAAIAAYENSSPENTTRMALAVFTRIHLRLRGLLDADAAELIQKGLRLTINSETPQLRRFHALFYLQAASHSRLTKAMDDATELIQEAAQRLAADGELADQFELHQEEALIHLAKEQVERALSSAGGALDRAEHPEQRLAAQFLMAQCKEAAGDSVGALATLDRAAAIVHDHKIPDGSKQLKERQSALIGRHPELDTATDDSEWI